MARAQTYENHRRWHPIWHFIVMPVLAANVVNLAWRAIRNPTMWSGWSLLVALAVLLGFLVSRQMSLIGQDRVIRLEEKIRLARVLPSELRGKEDGLTKSEYAALRFAPDDELPELMRRVQSGELKTSSDIKRAIRNWRADEMRV